MKQILKKEVIAGLFALVMCFSASVGAQTRFVQADTAIDFRQYKTVEDCMVLFERLSNQEISRLSYWKDSMEINGTELRDPIPPSVRDTVKLCTEKFHPDSAPINYYNEYADWIRLFLFSGRDNDAQSLLNRLIAGTAWESTDSLKRRDLVLLEVVGAYRDSRPLRWDMIKSLGSMFVNAGVKLEWTSMMNVYSQQFNLADQLGDDSVQRDMADKIITLAGTLDEQQTLSPSYVRGWRYVVTQARDHISYTNLMDSLRKSGPAYVALKTANWERSRGAAGGELPNYVGKIAPAIEGDFWFSRGPNASDSATRLSGTEHVFPSSAKVNLVVFLWSGCNRATGFFQYPYQRETQMGPCAASYASIRRLAKQFPSIDVTVVAHTTGYIGDTPLLTPEEEADTYKKWWLDFHKIPGKLAVSEIKFIRLPLPDNRRIDLDYTNHLNYKFGDQGMVGSRTAYLVDTDGTILHSTWLNPHSEKNLKDILNIITKRSK